MSSSKNIPKKIRTIIWDTYGGKELRSIPCYLKCGTMIKLEDFQCGHIQSRAENGTIDVSNLRPICRECNSSMGKQNMIDYLVTYGTHLNIEDSQFKTAQLISQNKRLEQRILELETLLENTHLEESKDLSLKEEDKSDDDILSSDSYESASEDEKIEVPSLEVANLGIDDPEKIIEDNQLKTLVLDNSSLGRICTKCNIWQEWSYFNKDKKSKTQHRSSCKKCDSIARKKCDENAKNKPIKEVIDKDIHPILRKKKAPDMFLVEKICKEYSTRLYKMFDCRAKGQFVIKWLECTLVYNSDKTNLEKFTIRELYELSKGVDNKNMIVTSKSKKSELVSYFLSINSDVQK